MLRSLLVSVVAVGLVAAPAQAATVPGHTSDFSTVRLLGASESGFVLEQNSAPATRLLAGAPSTTLTSIGSPLWGLVEAKGAYGWYREDSSVVRIDLRTKTRTTYATTAEPVEFTPDGWISVENNAFVRHVAGGATTTLLSGIDTSLSQPGAVADATGAVLQYDAVKNGVRDRYVSLVTFGKPGVDVVWTQSQGAIYQLQISGATLSPTQVSFATTTTFGGGGQFVHQRPRAGGAITTTAAPANTSASTLVGAGDALAVLEYTANYAVDPQILQVLSGGAWHRVTLPGPGGLLRSSGTRFYTGVTGKNTVAGVYGFGATGGATRVSPLAAAPALASGVSLSAGYLTVADNAVGSLLNNGSLWRRPVNADATLGAETRLTPSASVSDSQYVTAPVQFSAARGVIRQPGTDYPRATPFQIVDRGVVTRSITADEPNFDTAQISGPHVVIGRKAYRVDGTLAFDLGPTARAALFGKTLIYQLDGKILLRDLEKSTVTTLASSGICDANNNCGYGVSAWADRVAWQRADGKIVVRTLATSSNRVVDAGEGQPGFQLSDNTLTTQWGDVTSVLDLGSATSTLVAVPGLRDGVSDGHLIAGRDPSTFQVVVKKLPFSRPAPVRLIGTLAAASFTSAWTPQFDLTKPATGVKLTIRSGTTVVRTLSGTAPDGSIRDLLWDGRNTAGSRVAAGSYTYQLTATATDGEGALTTTTGTVRVA